jgi:hypothetical protein
MGVRQQQNFLRAAQRAVMMKIFVEPKKYLVAAALR